jgi:8-oxo-dGTP pyrophosphatase MutT (NUDIX family)
LGGKTLSAVQQAGGIVVRLDGLTPRFLVARAKKDPNHWIFPKGHIEKGEFAVDAAVREVEEEVGAQATVLGRVGSLEFKYGADTIHVEYYLLRYARAVEGGEQRESRWCDYDEAVALLSFDDSRKLLTRALRMVEELSGASSS